MALVAKKGVEFNRGATYERYSGEKTRGRVTAEGAALGGGAAAAGAGASSLAGAKLAGTPLGQTTLGAVESKLRLGAKPGSQHELAANQVRRYKKYGEWAGRNKLKTSAGIIGATGAAGLLRLGQKARQNEEAGISQGIGRMKAGEHYSGVRGRASKGLVTKATLVPLSLSSDVLTHPRFGPMAEKVLRNKGKLTAAGLGVAGAGTAVTAARTSQKHTREYKKLRGELRPTGKVVASKGGGAFALTGLVTGGAGLGSAGVARRHGEKQRARETQAATVGGWGGQGAYQGAMYGMKHKAIRDTKRATDIGNPKRKLSRNQLEQKILKPHKAEHGIGTTEYWRNYPKEAPAWRLNRATGWLGRGKTGTAVGGAATAAGAATGVHLVQQKGPNKRGRKVTASKADVSKLYVRDQQTSVPHLLGAAAGLGLGAWGFGRSRMVGAALSRGINMARGHQNQHAVNALQAAQSLQGILARGTAPGERALRQIRSVDQLVSRVPTAIRPEIALATGTLLVGHSRPIRRETYHPVNIRVRTYGGY